MYIYRPVESKMAESPMLAKNKGIMTGSIHVQASF